MNPEQAEWLARTTEPAIWPDEVVCDPHHHLWNHPQERYELAELRADTGAGHRVERTVFVECMSGYRTEDPEALRPVGETEYVVAMANEATTMPGAQIAGIVGFADLTLGEGVRDVLEAHVAAGGGRFRGIRHASAWDPSPEVRSAHTDPGPGLLGRDEFRAGFAVLADMGLTFDAWLYHPQIPDVTDLARAFPRATIVLDHLGGPLGIGPYAGRRDEVLAGWRRDIAELATCPNVVVKLGGIGMAIFGSGWHRQERPPTSEELAAAWAEPIGYCIDQFGPQRAMFESNFPVDRRGCSYVVLWNAFKRLSERYSADERAFLLNGTAMAAYRLS